MIRHQRPRLGRRGAVYCLSSFRRNNSGSFAMFTAMRRASSRVMRCRVPTENSYCAIALPAAFRCRRRSTKPACS
jgi:hypothetical protein